MRIRSIELKDFRSYTRFEFEPAEELTILVGPNAVGKTNAIEAIQLLTAAESFRKPKWDEVVRWGSESARLRMTASDGRSHLETKLEITAEGKRTYSVNGQTKRRISDVTGRLPCVVFTPEDLGLAKGPAEVRRVEIDSLGMQLSATYEALHRDYVRTVRNRNRLLKDEAPNSHIEPWTTQLIALGARLTTHRLRLLDKVRRKASQTYGDLAGGEQLAVAYESKSGLGRDPFESADETYVSSAMEECLALRASDERARRTTLVGPHRDDIVFSVSGKDARAYASQGQQRTIAIAWKLAEIGVVEDIARRTPVLLLDDVMSELDEVRRRALTEVVQRHVQTFVTTTNIDYFDQRMLSRALVVEIGRQPA